MFWRFVEISITGERKIDLEILWRRTRFRGSRSSVTVLMTIDLNETRKTVWETIQKYPSSGSSLQEKLLRLDKQTFHQ